MMPRRLLQLLEQPGIGSVKQVGFPIKLSRTPAAIEREAPALGGDTDAVLRAAGYDDDRIEKLREEGVV